MDKSSIDVCKYPISIELFKLVDKNVWYDYRLGYFWNLIFKWGVLAFKYNGCELHLLKMIPETIRYTITVH